MTRVAGVGRTEAFSTLVEEIHVALVHARRGVQKRSAERPRAESEQRGGLEEDSAFLQHPAERRKAAPASTSGSNFETTLWKFLRIKQTLRSLCYGSKSRCVASRRLNSGCTERTPADTMDDTKQYRSSINAL